MKLILIIAAVAIVISSAGCSENNAPSNDETVFEQTTAQTEIEIKTDEESKYNMNYDKIIRENISRSDKIARVLFDKYMYESKYKNGAEVYLAEKYNTNHMKRSGTASVWHYTSVCAMTSRLLACEDMLAVHTDAPASDGYFFDLYPALVDGFAYYSGTGDIITYQNTSKVTMYAVNRQAKKGSADISGVLAVYDDQMWIIRELLYSYNQSGDDAYLDECERLVKICLDGWDVSENASLAQFGGIPWGPGYASKHTCSNAPLISPLVGLYEHYRDTDSETADYYLGYAKKIYSFCRIFENDDGCYGDLVGSDRTLVIDKDGTTHYKTQKQGPEIDQSEYTYNTGTMIGGGAALYRATGDEKYLERASKNARAAYEIFASEGESGLMQYPITSTQWFNLILLEGFIELSPYDDNCQKYIDVCQKSLDYAYDNYNNDGLLPRDYLSGWNTKNDKDTEKDIMDIAAAGEMYALLALYYANAE